MLGTSVWNVCVPCSDAAKPSECSSEPSEHQDNSSIIASLVREGLISVEAAAAAAEAVVAGDEEGQQAEEAPVAPQTILSLHLQVHR